MSKYYFLILIVCILCISAACRTHESDVSGSEIGSKTESTEVFHTIDEIIGASSDDTEPSPTPKYEAHIKEVKPTSKPESESYAPTSMTDNANDFFAVLTCAVKGTVKGVKEYRVDDTYDGKPEGHYYFSVLSIKVDKQYGDAKLIYHGKDVIHVRYWQTSYDHIEGYPSLAKGDECILFLQNVAVDMPPFMDKDNAVYDYKMIYRSQSLLKKTASGYDAKAFMSMFGKTKQYYKLSEIEKYINKNTDKMKEIPYKDILLSHSKAK